MVVHVHISEYNKVLRMRPMHCRAVAFLNLHLAVDGIQCQSILRHLFVAQICEEIRFPILLLFEVRFWLSILSAVVTLHRVIWFEAAFNPSSRLQEFSFGNLCVFLLPILNCGVFGLRDGYAQFLAFVICERQLEVGFRLKSALAWIIG